VKRLRSHPGLRWLARVLTVTMVAPYLLCPTPARAQRSTPSVYVLDFNNRTKVGGALLGRVAAAQISLQLSESQNWDVVPDAQVQRRIQDQGLKQPFDRPNRVAIATGVDATAVVYGSITEARVTGAPAPQAYVSVQVLVEDVGTGVLINGAIVDGLSTPRMGFTGDADVLLEEALGKAAFKAREFMDRFRLPEGTVLNTTVVGEGNDLDLEALINIGARQGVRKGMELIVTRQREVVGRAKVVSVDSDISTARVTTNTQGVRPEDRVRAIFNFADFPITRTRLRSAADAANVVASAKPGDKSDDAREVRVARADRRDEFVPFRQQDKNLQIAQVTVDEPAPVVVEEPEVETGGGPGGKRGILSNNTLKMLVGGLLVMGLLQLGGRGGRNADRPDSVRAFSFQQGIGSPGAFIRITWDRPKTIRSSQVLQYIIWRTDSQGLPLAPVGAADTDAIKSLLDTQATRSFSAFDGDPGTEDAGGRTTFNAPGLVEGVEYRYQVATAYENGLEDRDMDGEPDDEDFMSPLSLTTKFVTAIAPPIIVDPTNGEATALSSIDVTWQQSRGANEYVIWVSSDPNFPDNKTVKVPGVTRTIPVDQGGDLQVTRNVNANTSKMRNARRVFITVGARNALDPAPQPRGAIFSAPVGVDRIDEPPPPPGGGGGGGGGTPPPPPTADGKGKKGGKKGR
jgi:hypothetical protein